MDANAEETPTGRHPVVDEAQFALGAVAARCEEIAGSIRAGLGRWGRMSEAERTAFVRDAVAALRKVEHFAAFGAHVFEELIGERSGVQTPRALVASPLRQARVGRAAKLITAAAALAGAVSALLHELFARR